MSNVLAVPEHKHCMFCGNVVVQGQATECKSTANATQPDTSGKRYHVVLS